MKGPSLIIEKFLAKCRLISFSFPKKMSVTKFASLLVFSALSFYCMAIWGGGGVNWLLDPRNCYYFYRKNVGFLYLLSIYFLLAAYIYYLFSTRKIKVSKVFYVTVLFSILAYFTGKKSNIIAFWVVGFLFYNFYIKSLSIKKSFFALIFGIFLIFFLLNVQSDLGFVDSLSYFDYMDTTALFLSRFDEFHFQFGKVFLSSLWVFVPRFVYSEKPHEFGAALIHQVLFPGAAETGHFSGYLGWSQSFLDFGIPGVFLNGLLWGFLKQAIYETFLRHKNDIIAFILMIHISIYEIFFMAPLSVLMLFCAALQLFIKLNFNFENIAKRVSK